MIVDFETDSDVFDNGGTNLSIVSGTTGAGAGAAEINSEGFCTFNLADDTLAERITAAESGINANGGAAAGQLALFTHGTTTQTYLFVSDGTDGLGANDVLFKLDGISGWSDTTITGGDMTIK